jgi:23S rRNA (guanosine2251-2'-O)-methyltransferase
VKSEILYGIHPVYEAMMAGRRRFFEIFFEQEKKSRRLGRLISLAEDKGILHKTVDADGLKTLVGATGHQGVAARVSSYPLIAVSDMLPKDAVKERKPFLLMLDSVLDPQNLGAIIRTALCVGVDGIVLPKDRSAPPTPSVSKASAGALEHIKLIRVTNLVNAIKECKKKGLWIYGLQKDAEQSIYTTDLSGSIAIVLGGEQKGIRPLVKRNCDFLVSIPQQGPMDSLNASVAASIAMYESFRQKAKG